EENEFGAPHQVFLWNETDISGATVLAAVAVVAHGEIVPLGNAKDRSIIEQVIVAAFPDLVLHVIGQGFDEFRDAYGKTGTAYHAFPYPFALNELSIDMKAPFAHLNLVSGQANDPLDVISAVVCWQL